MTDAMLTWQTERFLELETHRSGHVVHVQPEQVVEIARRLTPRTSYERMPIASGSDDVPSCAVGKSCERMPITSGSDDVPGGLRQGAVMTMSEDPGRAARLLVGSLTVLGLAVAGFVAAMAGMLALLVGVPDWAVGLGVLLALCGLLAAGLRVRRAAKRADDARRRGESVTG